MNLDLGRIVELRVGIFAYMRGIFRSGGVKGVSFWCIFWTYGIEGLQLYKDGESPEGKRSMALEYSSCNSYLFFLDVEVSHGG